VPPYSAHPRAGEIATIKMGVRQEHNVGLPSNFKKILSFSAPPVVAAIEGSLPLFIILHAVDLHKNISDMKMATVVSG
jgi:hypothetical protein